MKFESFKLQIPCHASCNVTFFVEILRFLSFNRYSGDFIGREFSSKDYYLLTFNKFLQTSYERHDIVDCIVFNANSMKNGFCGFCCSWPSWCNLEIHISAWDVCSLVNCILSHGMKFWSASTLYKVQCFREKCWSVQRFHWHTELVIYLRQLVIYLNSFNWTLSAFLNSIQSDEYVIEHMHSVVWVRVKKTHFARQ